MVTVVTRLASPGAAGTAWDGGPERWEHIDGAGRADHAGGRGPRRGTRVDRLLLARIHALAALVADAVVSLLARLAVARLGRDDLGRGLLGIDHGRLAGGRRAGPGSIGEHRPGAEHREAHNGRNGRQSAAPLRGRRLVVVVARAAGEPRPGRAARASSARVRRRHAGRRRPAAPVAACPFGRTGRPARSGGPTRPADRCPRPGQQPAGGGLAVGLACAAKIGVVCHTHTAYCQRLRVAHRHRARSPHLLRRLDPEIPARTRER